MNATLPAPRTTTRGGYVFRHTYREATPAERARISEGMRRIWQALESLPATPPPPGAAPPAGEETAR